MAARSSGVSGRGRAKVVVEAVVDRRPDPELRAGEEVEDGLGHDMRRRVAHGVEVAVGAGVEQLVGRAALGRLEADLGRFVDPFVRHRAPLLRIKTPLIHRQDER